MRKHRNSAPKPRNKKAKKQAGAGRAVGREVVHDVAHEAAGDALHQEPPGVGGAAAMYQPYFNYFPYGVEQYLKDEPCYVARSPWAPPGEALDRALGATDEVGKKVEELKGVVALGIADARAVAGRAQDALERTRDDVHDTHAVVQGVDDSLRQTHDAINKHYIEHSAKQDQCAAEITKVRTMLEEDAKNKERARQRQQDMQEAWNYYYQWFRQAEQEAERKRSSSKSSRRSRSSRSSSKTTTTTTSSSYGGRQTTNTTRILDDDLYTSEARQAPDHGKLKRSVLECLNQILGEAGSHADRPERNRQNHNHFHAYAPTSPPWSAQYYADPRDGWQRQPRQEQHQPPQPAPFPGRDDLFYYGSNATTTAHGGSGKRNPLGYQYNPFIHKAGWGERGPNYH
ncbi:hypothetical protein Daesc_004483 [Daldinia eschscholtzii]|uniref:Uncharacterized protein n=1 Tax=Daldinia eschscholtzii TaxID=292717 RepID=A0AAX6MPV7_9PEZI